LKEAQRSRYKWDKAYARSFGGVKISQATDGGDCAVIGGKLSRPI